MEKIKFPTFEEWLAALPPDKRPPPDQMGAARNSYYTQWGVAINKAKGFSWA